MGPEPVTGAPTPASFTLTLDGQAFALPKRLSVGRAGWMSKAARRAGLQDLSTLAKPETPDQAQQLLERIVQVCLDTDAVPALLAGGLEREGEEWTVEQARQNEAAFADATVDEGLCNALAVVVASFLAREPALWRSMLRCFQLTEAAGDAGPRPSTTSGPSSPSSDATSGPTSSGA